MGIEKILKKITIVGIGLCALGITACATLEENDKYANRFIIMYHNSLSCKNTMEIKGDRGRRIKLCDREGDGRIDELTVTVNKKISTYSASNPKDKEIMNAAQKLYENYLDKFDYSGNLKIDFLDKG